MISDDFAPGLEPRTDMRSRLVRSDGDVARLLKDREIRFQTLGVLGLQSRLREEGAAPLVGTAALQIAVKLRDGRVANIWLVPALTLSRPSAALIASGLVVVLLSIALGLAIAAVTLRPIRQLEQDAAQVELGDARSGISETGPAELRRVSAALNRMRDRLTGLIREREQMVAAIAHDVRTGVTRIRLRMDERGAVSAHEIEADIAQMEALITDMLAMRARRARRRTRNSSASTASSRTLPAPRLTRSASLPRRGRSSSSSAIPSRCGGCSRI